jgi:hypothetical protein
MAKRGRKFTFHGAFKSKARAAAKERRISGAFVRRVKMRRIGVRYLVLTR